MRHKHQNHTGRKNNMKHAQELTVGSREGKLLGDGEVREQDEEESEQEPHAEVLLTRPSQALQQLPLLAPHPVSPLPSVCREWNESPFASFVAPD
jgi:hypothetical protein